MELQIQLQVTDYKKLIKKITDFEIKEYLGKFSCQVVASKLGNAFMPRLIKKFLENNEIDIILNDISVSRTGDVYDLNIDFSDEGYGGLIVSLYNKFKSGKFKVLEPLYVIISKYEDVFDEIIDDLTFVPKDAYIEIISYVRQFSDKLVDLLNSKLQSDNINTGVVISSISF